MFMAATFACSWQQHLHVYRSNIFMFMTATFACSWQQHLHVHDSNIYMFMAATFACLSQQHLHVYCSNICMFMAATCACLSQQHVHGSNICMFMAATFACLWQTLETVLSFWRRLKYTANMTPRHRQKTHTYLNCIGVQIYVMYVGAYAFLCVCIHVYRNCSMAINYLFIIKRA